MKKFVYTGLETLRISVGGQDKLVVTGEELELLDSEVYQINNNFCEVEQKTKKENKKINKEEM